MTLKDDAKTSLENFDSITSEQIVSVLSQVKSHFKSELTREYLEGKLAGIKKAQSEQEKKSLCKNLKPYLDWYVQGKM